MVPIHRTLFVIVKQNENPGVSKEICGPAFHKKSLRFPLNKTAAGVDI